MSKGDIHYASIQFEMSSRYLARATQQAGKHLEYEDSMF